MCCLAAGLFWCDPDARRRLKGFNWAAFVVREQVRVSDFVRVYFWARIFIYDWLKLGLWISVARVFIIILVRKFWSFFVLGFWVEIHFIIGVTIWVDLKILLFLWTDQNNEDSQWPRNWLLWVTVFAFLLFCYILLLELPFTKVVKTGYISSINFFSCFVFCWD